MLPQRRPALRLGRAQPNAPPSGSRHLAHSNAAPPATRPPSHPPTIPPKTKNSQKLTKTKRSTSLASAVLCNPFGYDAADFPQSDHFHTLASGCYAQLESETLIADHVEGLSGAASAGVGKSGLPKEVERELRMMTAADEEEWLTPDGKVRAHGGRGRFADPRPLPSS